MPAAERAARRRTITEGDWLSIDGGTGAIYLGRGKVVCERPTAELAQVQQWRAGLLPVAGSQTPVAAIG